VDKGPPNVASTLGPRDVLLEKDFAKSNSFDVGDTVRATTPIGRKLNLKVRGTFDDKAALIGDFAVNDETIRREFGIRDDFLEFVAVQPGAEPKVVQSRIDKLLEARFPIAEAQSQKEFQDSITGNIDISAIVRCVSPVDSINACCRAK